MADIISAIAVFFGRVRGYVRFVEIPGDNGLSVEVNLHSEDHRNSAHGFHIHEAGDLSDTSCAGACAHFNPDQTDHGGLNDAKTQRHAGDLGNIFFDATGRAKTVLIAKGIRLRAQKYNIIGRSVIVHADEDDLGRGGNAESKRTGNAGARIACAVIGYARENFDRH